ncbi:unnamed protein product [Rotaria sordida]|uniref:Uncharacterized protein n=2 Tax=Rotaria sordida TaxID=392033 RepID=A0A814N3X6_9BILA|nr:unnamed protein product [Rotaria sordida]
MNRFTIVQRSFFIFSLIALFWIIFIIIYMLSRIIIRFITNFKRLRIQYDSPSISNEKICRAFVISSNQYGSFRPTYLPTPLLYRSNSLFSNCDFILNNNEQTTSQTVFNINLQSNTTNPSLLEYYLKTYNPLNIDLKNNNNNNNNNNQEIITTSPIKDESYEEAPSDTDTRPIANCYALNCTNKRKLYHGRQYTRLKEQENCSATMSIADDRLSECSTKLTTITLPTVMITDCSDGQRLHTDIIELNEDEKDK